MCGIAGLFNATSAYAETTERDRLVRQMINSIAHRGPDAEGVWHDTRGRCSLGHRRLSIIDTSDAGRQPMVSSSKRWIISFNGEIYNFQELRGDLLTAGVTVRGRSDTEVLLEALTLWGADALSRVDGMFAFAAFDTASGQLLLARDPFGEKPLYYVELAGGGLAFASELQALELLPGVDLEISIDSVAELLMFQYIGAPRTIYQHMRKLRQGHCLAMRAGEPPRVTRYFEFDPGAMGFDTRPLVELADELESILERSLRRRLISDVPLGAFLSGGVDSSTVCALVRRRLGLPLKTFSIGFEGSTESEHLIARQFAKHLGAEHKERVLVPDVSDFLLHVGSVLDEPNADSSCLPTYLLSRFARESVTVALSGDGGDEMFGGYGRYLLTLDERRGLVSGTDLSAGQSYYSQRILVFSDEHVNELMGECPPAASLRLRTLRQELNSPNRPLFCRLRKTDVDNYMPGAVLPKVDRMSMQHALEVRTPFLNVELARFAEKLPASALFAEGRGKRVLREIAYRYLPRTLVDLPKRGFGLPVTRWGERELGSVAAQLLDSDDSRLRQLFGSERLDRFLARQRTKDRFSTYQTWSICMLESWLRHHPACLPQINSRVHAAVTGIPRFVAKRITDGVYVVAENNGAESSAAVAPRPRQDERDALEVVWRLGRYAFGQLIRRSADNAERRHYAADAVPLTGSDDAPRAALDDALLIILDARIVRALTTEALESFRRAGASALIYMHPFRRDGSLVRIELRERAKQVSDQEELRSLAIASWRGVDVAQGQRAITIGPLIALPSVPSSELSHQFMLFEGTRQCAPIPASHADIDKLGGGRYSVWERHCRFAPIGGMHASEYFLIERTPASDAYLHFATGLVVPPPLDVSPFIDALGAIVQQRGEPSPRAWQTNDLLVVLTHALPTGGAERQWCYLALALKRLGRRVVFLLTESLENGAHYWTLLQRAGVELIEVGRLSLSDVVSQLPADLVDADLFFAENNPFGVRLLQLTACLSRLRPTAVFSQLDSTNLLAGAAALLADVPCAVLSFRNYRPTRFSYLDVPWFRAVYQCIVQSPRVQLAGNSMLGNADYADWLGISPQRVAYVPNAIEAEDVDSNQAEARAGVRNSLNLAQETQLILGVFRLSDEKDPFTFLDVCAQVFTCHEGAAAAIVGEGPLHAAIEARIHAQGLSGRIRLLGPRSDVAALMMVADLLLLTSRWEGMPNAVMEAQLLGLPVVATNVGAISDIVLDMETGFLRGVGDVAGLSEACLQILRDSSRARDLGVAASTRMRSFSTKEQMAQRYLKIVVDEESKNSSADTSCGSRRRQSWHVRLLGRG